MTAPQKTHYADDETWVRISKLERDLLEANERAHDYLESCKAMFNQHCNLIAKRESLEERCRALELSAKQSAEQVEDLKAALRFYASEENYYAKLVTPEDELYHVVLIPVCDDRGEIARRALQNG